MTTNVFDQFDEVPSTAGGNVFDQFDEAPAPAPVAQTARKTNAFGHEVPAQAELVAIDPPKSAKAGGKALTGGETAALIGQQIYDAALYHLPGAFASALEGDDPYAEKDWKDTLVERSRQRMQESHQAGDGQAETAIPGVNVSDAKSLGPSLGFSGVGMGAGLAVGVPATIAGTAVAPGIGTAAGIAAGAGASGVAAYRMATNQFVRDLHDAVNEASINETGKPVSTEDFAKKQAELAGYIKEYGLWEAVPEAASNAIGFGVLKAGVKGAIGKMFGKNVATRLASKMGSLYGSELATETVTQQGQHNVETDAGLSDQPRRDWTSPEDVAQSFKEVAPSTVLQTTLMAGGVKGGMMLKDRFGKPVAQEAAPVEGVVDAPVAAEAVTAEQPVAQPVADPSPDLQMQNRDRGTAASVVQMQSIANAPDFDRLGASPIADVGAPLVSINENVEGAIEPADIGDGGEITLPDGAKVPFRYAVVEAGSILASHNAAGLSNPDYGNPQPGQLVALTNGRTAGLQDAYARGTAGAPGGYMDRLTESAQQFGIDPQAVVGKEAPVLVRVYDDAVNARPDIGKMSNSGGSMRMSATEVARNDARVLPDIGNLVVAETGDIDTPANAPFIRGFIQALPENERAEVVDKQGRLSQVGMRRIRNAIVHRAYGESSVFGRLVESMDSGLANVSKALVRAAPKVARVKELMAAGAARDMDITQILVNAVSDLERMRQNGISLAEFLAQARLLDQLPAESIEILAFLDSNLRAPNRIAAFIEGYYRQVEGLGDPRTSDMFGTPDVSAGQMLNNAARAAQQEVQDNGSDEIGGSVGSSEGSREGDTASASGAPGIEAAPGVPVADQVRADLGSGQRQPEGAGGSDPEVAVPATAFSVADEVKAKRAKENAVTESPQPDKTDAGMEQAPAPDVGKEGVDLSWAEVLVEAWNNGFETGNTAWVPVKQDLEDAYQRSLTDAQVSEYTETYQSGARKSIAAETVEPVSAVANELKAKRAKNKSKSGAPTPDSGELGSRSLRNQDAGAASVRAVTGALEEPAQSGSGAGSKANATDIPAAVQDSAIKAARREQDRLNEFDLQEEIRSLSENGGVDLSSLHNNPEYWDAENEEFTNAGLKEVDRLTEAKARDNIRLPALDTLPDLNNTHQFAQVEAMEEILDGLGIPFERNYSFSTSRYIMVSRGEGVEDLKLRFSNHLNTAKGQPSPDINVAHGGDTFMDAVSAVVEVKKAEAPPAGEAQAQEGTQDGRKEQKSPETPEVLSAPVDVAAHEAATSPQNDLPAPTPAQVEAGNYRKGHLRIGGLDISVENPAGSERKGVDPNGKSWSVTLKSHYGYIRGTMARDGDHVDAFIRPGIAEDFSGAAFVIDQAKANGHFDEQKVMLGWDNAIEARAAYLENYEKGWDRIRAMTRAPFAAFKQWIDDGDHTQPFSRWSPPVAADQIDIDAAFSPENRDALYKAVAGKQIAIDVEVAETGETAKLEMDAGKSLKKADERVSALEALVQCLRG